MQTYYTFIALQLANERAQEAEAQRRANLARSAQPARPSYVRRLVGAAVSGASRVVNAVAERLEGPISDDLRRPRASTE